uniref:Uncharacterized protein n=1 Tax=Oryza punctata TaxID=4537 RepID=A0A0E0LC82_ORYPU
MGNCLNPASKVRHGGEPTLPPPEEEWCYTTPEPDAATTRTIGHVLREEAAEEETAASAAVAAAAGVKVKVVLKRAELEWLMAQLKTGDRRLEDVLNQMATARAISAAAARVPPRVPRARGRRHLTF